MHHIDMHCDSVEHLCLADESKRDLYHTDLTMVDFERMKKAGQMAQFFAAWLPPQRVYKHYNHPLMMDDDYVQTCHDILTSEVEKHSDLIAMAYSGEDIERNWAEGKMSAMFTVEDGRAIEADMNKLKKYHDELGVRALTLTWNYYNCFGAPNSWDPIVMHDGLTEWGKEAVRYMQELGIMIDVSHLSEGGFWDVVNNTTKPFVATHSNARGLSPHKRNLSDDQLRALAKCGGCTGINFGPEFLNTDINDTSSTAVVMAKQARYMANIGGVDIVAIGTDFDGIHGELEIGSCDKMGLLEEALKVEGFTNEEIEKISYKNVLRVLKDCVK